MRRASRPDCLDGSPAPSDPHPHPPAMPLVTSRLDFVVSRRPVDHRNRGPVVVSAFRLSGDSRRNCCTAEVVRHVLGTVLQRRSLAGPLYYQIAVAVAAVLKLPVLWL